MRDSLWQALATGIPTCRLFSGLFFASAVGSCREDQKPGHGECGMLRAGLLCCYFCWDLDHAPDCGSVGPCDPPWVGFPGEGEALQPSLGGHDAYNITVQCAHTGIVAVHNGKTDWK